MDNLQQHKQLLQQIHDTYVKKNHDYGDSFSRSFKKYGLVAAMVRMEDKWNRLDNMALGAEQKVADETIRDTLLDLAGYCIMTTMELDREKDNTNQKAFEKQVRDEYAEVFEEDNENENEEMDISDKTSSLVCTFTDSSFFLISDDSSLFFFEKLEKSSIDVGKVMALHNAKWSQAKIADEMGCSQGRISQIIKEYKQ